MADCIAVVFACRAAGCCGALTRSDRAVRLAAVAAAPLACALHFPVVASPRPLRHPHIVSWLFPRSGSGRHDAERAVPYFVRFVLSVICAGM